MDNCFSEEAKDLINKLLVIDPNQRLGSGKYGIEKLKQHPYFKNINWEDLKELKVTPPFIPDIIDDNSEKDGDFDNYVNFSYYEDSHIESSENFN